jgi:hypothetical protein
VRVRNLLVLGLCFAFSLAGGACHGETVSEGPDAGAPAGALPSSASSGTAASDASPSGEMPGEPLSQEPPTTAGPTPPDAAASGADAATQWMGGAVWTSDDGPILGLALDADRIFCVTQSKLTSLARDGSAPRILAQSSDRFAYTGAIATNGVAVYWGVASPSGGVLVVSPEGDGGVSIGMEGYATVGIALDESSVYWMTNDSVMSAPLTGEGMPTNLATLQGLSYEDAFTLVDGMLYWSTNSSATGPATAGLFRMPATGGMASMIAPGPVFSVESTGTGAVAWLENPTPVLVESATSASTGQRIALPGQVSEFATDGARWYWRDDRTGAVWAIAAANGTPDALTQPVTYATANLGDGRHILVDQSEVVWADRTGPIAQQPDVNVLRVLRLAQ